MKKILVFFVFAVISASSFSQIDFKFKGAGGGLSLGSQAAWNKTLGSSMGAGIYFNGLAQLMENIDAEASLVFYFPSKPISGYKYSLTTFSLNGHYNFYHEDKILAYGIGGLTFSHISSKTPSYTIPTGMGGTIVINGSSNGDTKLGLNIGVGGNYEINEMLDATAQLGYTISNADQLYINLGVLYKF